VKTIRPDSEMASGIVSVHEAAQHFGVDVVTIRRWLKTGCPCVRRGRRGPGRCALVDLAQVARWRGEATVAIGVTVEDALQRIASALCDALMNGQADIRAGIDRASCAAVLVVGFEACCRAFGKSYRFDQLPGAIRTLMSEL